MSSVFRSKFCEDMLHLKQYLKPGCETWDKLSKKVVDEVCGNHLSQDDQYALYKYISEMKFLPGGRYLYYAGRGIKFYNNCFLIRAEEDTREDWASVTWKNQRALMTGGGVGTNYSVYRPSGTKLGRTGGIASGPLSMMHIVNEVGRFVRQGGSRRSALWAGLNWDHDDIMQFMTIKNWEYEVPGTGMTVAQIKEHDFGFHAPLDCTNISVLYDTSFIEQIHPNLPSWEIPTVFRKNVGQALRTGEPGFCFDFYTHEGENLRNACGEISSKDDSDVCNLGSVNMSRIESLDEFRNICDLGTKFLVCGTLEAEMPYEKINDVRKRNRRIGLGLMGIHEWLIRRGYDYQVYPELAVWLKCYRDISDFMAYMLCDKLSISRPVGVRAIAPNGSLSLISGTTSGIEPVYALAYKRRYLDMNTWHNEIVVDTTAKYLIEQGIDPDKIETALSLSKDIEKRLRFQADIQNHVDHCISSTVNLPSWGSEWNNPTIVERVTDLILKYCRQLRGLTFYPDGARGGQPITEMDYREAVKKEGECFVEGHDVCSIAHKSTCES